MSTIDKEMEETAHDPTSVDQGNMPTNNSDELGDSEEMPEQELQSNLSDSGEGEVQEFNPEQDNVESPDASSPTVTRIPVIEGVIFSGLNIMTVNSNISPRGTHLGTDLSLVAAQVVQTGSPLFDKYSSHKGVVIHLANSTSWQDKLGKLTVRETLTEKFKFLHTLPKLGGDNPATFMKGLISRQSGLKLLVLYNLVDFLPNWRVTKNNPTLLRDDLNSLDSVGVERGIAILAVVDLAEQANKNLMLNYGYIEGASFSRLRVMGKYLGDGTPEVRLSVNGFNIPLGIVKEGGKNKWAEKAPIIMTASVSPNTNQGKVLAAIKEMTGEFTVTAQ